MRRFITAFIVIFAALGGSNLCAQQKQIAEEVVAIVGNRQVSMSELHETTERIINFRRANGVTSDLQPAEEALEMLLNQKLYACYGQTDSLDKDLKVDETDIQNRIDEMVERAGSLRELERVTGKAIFQLREDYKRDLQEAQLANSMEMKLKRAIRINYRDVADFYEQLNLDSLPMMPPMIAYSQIVMVPPATDERRFAVRQELLALRERILAGEKMAVLARLYSEDLSRMQGGEISAKWGGENVAAFEDAVRQLNEGQISEIIETEYGFHIIEVVSKGKDDYVARHILRKPQFTEEEKVKVTRFLDSVANLVRTNELNFAQAALRFSEDVETRNNGGIAFNIMGYKQTGDINYASRMFILDQIASPIESRMLNRLKIGEVSAPFESMDNKGNRVYKIVKLDEQIPTHKVSMEYDYNLIRGEALNEKQNKVLGKWINDSIKKIYVYIAPEYLNYRLKNDGWYTQNSLSAQRAQQRSDK